MPASLSTAIYCYAYWSGGEGGTNVESMSPLPLRMCRVHRHSEAHLDVGVRVEVVLAPGVGLEQDARPARRDVVLVQGDGQVRRLDLVDLAVVVAVAPGGAVEVEAADPVLDVLDVIRDDDIQDDLVSGSEVGAGLGRQPFHLGRGGVLVVARVGELGIVVVPVLVAVAAGEQQGAAGQGGEHEAPQGGHGTLHGDEPSGIARFVGRTSHNTS